MQDTSRPFQGGNKMQHLPCPAAQGSVFLSALEHHQGLTQNGPQITSSIPLLPPSPEPPFPSLKEPVCQRKNVPYILNLFWLCLWYLVLLTWIPRKEGGCFPAALKGKLLIHSGLEAVFLGSRSFLLPLSKPVFLHTPHLMHISSFEDKRHGAKSRL